MTRRSRRRHEPARRVPAEQRLGEPRRRPGRRPAVRAKADLADLARVEKDPRRRAVQVAVGQLDRKALPVDRVAHAGPQPRDRQPLQQAVCVEEVLDQVDRHREAGPLARRVARQLHLHDADHIAVLVEHRPAAVAGLHRRVRLQEARLALRVLARGGQRPRRHRHLRDDAQLILLRHLHLAAERKAEHPHAASRLERVRVPEGQVREIGRRHLQRGEVAPGIRGDHVGLPGAPASPAADEDLDLRVLERDVRLALAPAVPSPPRAGSSAPARRARSRTRCRSPPRRSSARRACARRGSRSAGPPPPG